MKTFSLFLSTVAIAIAGSPAAQTPCPCSARYAYNVSDVSCGQSVVRIGSTEKEVLAILGAPQRTSGAVWMYRNCYVRETVGPQRNDCTQLSVSFRNHVVSDLKLVTPAAAEHIAARAQIGQPVAYVSAAPTPVAANP